MNSSKEEMKRLVYKIYGPISNETLKNKYEILNRSLV